MANKLRKKKKNGFSMIANDMFGDKRLSRKARGLLGYMLTKPDNRSFNDTDLKNRSVKEGRTVVENAKKELKELGYLVIKPTRDNKGKIGYDWYVTDEPYTGLPHTGKPSTDEPGTGQPSTDNLQHSNTDSNNTDIEGTKVHSDHEVGTEIDSINSDDTDSEEIAGTPPPPGSENPPPEEYGNTDINALIQAIKDSVAAKKIAYNKTRDREFARRILEAKEYGAFVESIGKTRQEFALNIIDVSIAISYFKGPCAGPMSIYQNYADVYNRRQLLKLKPTDPIKAWVDEILDEKLKSQILKEIEARKEKHLETTVSTLEKIKTRLLASS